jgi:hypothetical protein
MVDCPRQNLPHLHMPPPATICGSNISSVELSGNGVEACMAGRLEVSNDWQQGRKLRRNHPTGRAHALHGAGGIKRT